MLTRLPPGLLLLACSGDATEKDTAPSGDDAGTDGADGTGEEGGDGADGADGTDGGGDTGTADGGLVLVTTVSDDYSVGALAGIGMESWLVYDNLTALTGDARVVVDDGMVYQLNGYGYDFVRIYQRDQWTSPQAEFSTGDYSNPVDAQVCGGQLYISLYGGAGIGVYDPGTGILNGMVDLSDYADADGQAEPATMLEINGKLYVALQRMKTDVDYTSDQGAIIELDCEASTISRSWEVGPSPSIHPWLNHSELLVRTGNYFVLDGALSILNLSSGELGEPLLQESELGVEITDAVASSTAALVVTTDADSKYTIHCYDMLEGTLTELETLSSFLMPLATTSRGEAWFPARPSWADPEAEAGLIVYNVAGCASITGPDWLQTELPPYSVSFFE
jgi:hypothetical protein